MAARNCKVEKVLGGSATMDGISAYASLLPASKLEELEGHKNPAISKWVRLEYLYTECPLLSLCIPTMGWDCS